MSSGIALENLPLLMSQEAGVKSQEQLEAACLNMAKAAMYGGNAINTQLAGYVHAFAHSIGATYHLSHGQAISLMLLPVLEFQKEACQAHYEAIAKYCGVPDFLQAIRELITACDMDKNVCITEHPKRQRIISYGFAIIRKKS